MGWSQVAELAVKHLVVTMRHIMQRLVSCCVALSAGAPAEPDHPATRWLVTAFMRDSRAIQGAGAETLKWDHFHDGRWVKTQALDPRPSEFGYQGIGMLIFCNFS
eukprot:scaffold669863_cov57-Prasinocladus_malaysianus.AAC.1